MIRKTIPLAFLIILAGCSSRDADLKRFIETTQQEQPGGIEPLPEVKPYERFVYDPAGMRSPFSPGGAGGASSSVRPVSNRNREFLEQFPLDSLKMAGTLTVKGRTYGLVMTSDNLLQRVLVGNYVGQFDGKITKISPSEISIIEIVPDQLGGYIERATALTLND